MSNLGPIIIWRRISPHWFYRIMSLARVQWVCIYENGLLPGVSINMTLEEYHQLYPEMKPLHEFYLNSEQTAPYTSLLDNGNTVLIDKPAGVTDCFYESHHSFHLTNNIQLLKLVNNKIREPLSNLVGAIILAEQQQWTNEQQHVLDNIKASNYRLISLVNDLVDTLDIVQGNIVLDIQSHNVVDIIQSILPMLSKRAQQRQISIVFRPGRPEQSMVALIDYNRFKQILMYMLDNAILYSRGQSIIKIKVRKLPESSKCQIVISNKSHSQVVIDHTKGFGIYIAKKLANLMSGKLQYKIEADIVYTIITLVCAVKKRSTSD